MLRLEEQVAGKEQSGLPRKPCVRRGDPQAFTYYLKSYGNTIFGRHPISVFLSVRCLTTSFASPASLIPP